MSLENFSQEELKRKSMVELTRIILKDEKKAIGFHELFDQIAEIKGLTEEEKEEAIAQYYTELNVDGRFLTLGSNVWGLKEWYSIEQVEEEVTSVPKKRRKKKADEDTDEDEIELLDEDEELDFEDEEIAELGEEDEENLDEYDELFDEEEIDEDLDEVDIDLEDEDENI